MIIISIATGRYPVGKVSGTHFVRDIAGRRYDRLCRRNILRRRQGREVRDSGQGGDIHGYDVHARCPESDGDADGSRPVRLKHRNSFNIASMSFDPEIIYNEIKKFYPDFVAEYRIDPVRQQIADSWPDMLDDSCARAEWDWKPDYDLESMSIDMIDHLKKKLLK